MDTGEGVGVFLRPKTLVEGQREGVGLRHGFRERLRGWRWRCAFYSAGPGGSALQSAAAGDLSLHFHWLSRGRLVAVVPSGSVYPNPPSGVYALSFVVLSGVSLTYSFFRLLSSTPQVSCPCFAAPGGLLAVVRCRSDCPDCRLALSLGLFSLSSAGVWYLPWLFCLA